MKKKLIVIAVFLLLAVILFRLLTSYADSEKPEISIIYKPTRVVYKDNGNTYEVHAAAGHVVMIMDESETSEGLEALSHKTKLKVLRYFPETGYFLLQVNEGEEGKVIEELSKLYTKSFICPDILLKTCSTHTYCLDNFNSTHGKLVNDIILDQGHIANNHPINLGIGNDYISLDAASAELIAAIENASDDDKLVVNMSFGPDELNNWDNASNNRQDSYKLSYFDQVNVFLNIVSKYPNMDIVLVQASGNEGIKNFDGIILSYIYDQIKKEAKEKKSDSHEQMYLKSLNKSYIFVSAEDRNDNTYSNDVYNNGYHSLVTTVDITEWKDSDGVHHEGTSFAAPVITGIIADVAEKEDLSVEEVLALVKRATKEKEDHIINKQDVLNLVELAKEVGEIPEAPGVKYVDLALSSGTMWSTCNEGALSPEDLGYFYTKEAIEELYDKNADVFLGYSNFEKMTLGCRLPSKTQVEELMEECSWKYTDLNGVKGYDVIGSNGNSIFIPFAGVLPFGYMRDDFDSESEFGVGYEGLYWVSDNSSDNDAMYLMKLTRTENKLQTLDDRADAQFSVRPVMGGTFTENNRSEITESGKRVHTKRPDLSMVMLDLIGENIYDIEDWQLQIEDIKSLGLEYENSSNNVYAVIIKMDVNVRMLRAVSKICVIYFKNPDATWSYDKFHVISTSFPKQEDFSEYVSVEDTYQEFGRSLTVTNNSAYDLFVAIECVWDKKKPESTYAVVKSNETESVYYYFGRQPEYKIKFAYRI